MGRPVLIFLVVLVGVWALWNALITTDLDRVEQDVKRVVALALEGGEASADEILAAFADDYRGTGMFALDDIERRLKRWVVPGKVRSLQTGDFKVLSTGSEIEVPLLAIYADLDGWDVKMLIRLTYAQRRGDWKIVNISRINWGS